MAENNSKPTSTIDYKSIFQSLQSRYDFKSTKKITKRVIHPSKAQHNILDSLGCKDFFYALGFNTSSEANAYVIVWKTQKDKFVERLGVDPCLGHCKVLMEKFNILYIDQEDSLSKSQAGIMLKKKILKGLNS
jgi:translation elongation factor EF-1alpha